MEIIPSLKTLLTKKVCCVIFFRYAFSKNGLPTIASKNPRVTSFGNGKNGEATGSDIEQIKKAYCKSTPVVTSKEYQKVNKCFGMLCLLKCKHYS